MEVKAATVWYKDVLGVRKGLVASLVFGLSLRFSSFVKKAQVFIPKDPSSILLYRHNNQQERMVYDTSPTMDILIGTNSWSESDVGRYMMNNSMLEASVCHRSLKYRS